jgi:WD40 repeat protein
VLRVWDVERGVVIATYGRAASITDVAFHGNMLAAASTDRRIHVWDTATGGKRQFVGHHDQLRSVSFTDDGRSLVSASEDETIKLWRLTGPH